MFLFQKTIKMKRNALQLGEQFQVYRSDMGVIALPVFMKLCVGICGSVIQ